MPWSQPSVEERSLVCLLFVQVPSARLGAWVGHSPAYSVYNPSIIRIQAHQ